MPVQEGGPNKKKLKTDPSAIRKLLEASTVSPLALQREAMGTDVDLQRFVIYLNQKARFDLADRITEATINRSIEASSILTVTINDYDRSVLNSGLLYNKLDVEVDGLWFRLMGVDKMGDDLMLTFEDREIAVLRTYNKWKIANRSKVTRAMFIWNLIHEVKEFEIPFVIPELRIFQPIAKYEGDLIGQNPLYDKTIGVGYDEPKSFQNKNNKQDAHDRMQTGFKYTVKGAPATKEQKTNADIVIQVGDGMEGVTRRIIVSAIMTCIVESELINLPDGMDDSAGLFQQRPSMGWGSYAEVTDPATAARTYFKRAIAYDKENPNVSLNDLCQGVQRSGVPNAYGQWINEAKVFVTGAGIPGDDVESSAGVANNSFENTEMGGEYYFYRGKFEDARGDRARRPEDSWTCIQRLADVVNWRAFFVSGTFYYISEDRLMKSKPMWTLDEFADGIKRVDGNFYQKKRAATLTVTADVGRWTIPPGAVVEVEDLGVFNGRWLVSSYERSLFGLEATINLSRERPMLPEPLEGNEETLRNWIPGAASGALSGSTMSDAHDRAESAGTGEKVDITGTERQLASRLLAQHGQGNWIDHNSGQSQITKVRMGQNLTNKCGESVKMDARTMQVVLWLISKGYTIGTYAWCEDHDCLTDSGKKSMHSLGLAVDISDINGKSSGNTVDAIEVAALLNGLKGELAPRQLICGGWGGVRNEDMRALSIPSAAYFGEDTMAGHCDHIHVGY